MQVGANRDLEENTRALGLNASGAANSPLLPPMLFSRQVRAAVESDYQARFSGVARLYGTDGAERLRMARVCIVGVGGVGSWAVEALARTGVGALALVDFDEVCVSNVNRQLPAVTSEIGRPKVQVLRERVAEINPECEVNAVEEFFTSINAETILAHEFNCVLGAIDDVANKALLLAECARRRIPAVTVGGAGGRRDATALRVSDLAFTTHDRLLQRIRKILRFSYDFPEDPKTPFGIPCVYSVEAPVYPQPDGTVCEKRGETAELRMNCNSGYGSAAFVTGAFGFAAAAEVVRLLATRGESKNRSEPGATKESDSRR
jgi:tRNA threonylcarbamoyladenosine dehydratase